MLSQNVSAAHGGRVYKKTDKNAYKKLKQIADDQIGGVNNLAFYSSFANPYQKSKKYSITLGGAAYRIDQKALEAA